MKKKIEISQAEIDHLKVKDRRMSDLIEYLGEINRYYTPDPFTSLAQSIVYQQLSGSAADSIWKKVNNILPKLTPEAVAAVPENKLKEAGLSERKVNYLNNLAEAVLENNVQLAKIEELSDEEIIEQLTAVKGIGRWTAEMFLIFSLVRRNVISYHDLGIRKGIQWFYGLKSEPTEKDFKKFERNFSPYNTAASFYIWEITAQNLDQVFKNAGELSTANKVAYYDSPIGLIELQASQGELLRLHFQEVKRYQEGEAAVLAAAKKQLDEYFEGERKKFKLPLRIEGTDFQESVWRQLREIPYGATFSYKEVAEAIGNNKAYRAVGNANNKNSIPVIIPCHRVTASSGKIGGYGAGIWRKKWLLEHEKKNKL
ncbi:DNA-3-methyladenine glycosylase II [Halanaerobium saccharolyticum]|jgi:DNA-3-methyladenine glycosylase II|uniref:Methylated-DNA--protein-cysteine methyltransferase n=1 Tax=Halanaerobium saccharolyticum TaxID=43595 RepID=A0A4R6SF25_9FIRM|nr:methylated-DNA--[protein]-cysteine S-methyltransferase [Halanaerobium saccharolyticum]TDQ00090.1 DNA-3-methyladenine glycosylase II [Halanaerobium saccharolyticum]